MIRRFLATPFLFLGSLGIEWATWIAVWILNLTDEYKIMQEKIDV